MKDNRRQLIGLMSINGGIYHHGRLPERYRLVPNLESPSYLTGSRISDILSLCLQYVRKKIHTVR